MKSTKTLDDYTDYRSAVALLEQTKGRLTDARSEVSRLQQEINHQQRADTVAAEAEALLTGGEIGENVGGLRDQLARARHQQRVAEKAVAMQRQAVDSLRGQFSAEMCSAALPQYQELVAEAVAAAVSLAKAFGALREFRQGLEDSGALLANLPQIPSHLHALGRWADPGANIHATISEAKACGLIDSKDFADAPTLKGAYDALPVGREVATLGAGPAGVFRATVTRGGKMKVGEWLSKARDDFSRGAWSGN